MSPSLMQRTLDLLKTRPRDATYATIAERTGLTAVWIAEFAAQKHGEYGITRVQKLHDHLASLTAKA